MSLDVRVLVGPLRVRDELTEQPRVDDARRTLDSRSNVDAKHREVLDDVDHARGRETARGDERNARSRVEEQLEAVGERRALVALGKDEVVNASREREVLAFRRAPCEGRC